MSKLLVGLCGVVVFYIALFFLALMFEDASVIAPIGLLEFLLVYAVAGCAFMVFVLPVAVINGERRADRSDNTPNQGGTTRSSSIEEGGST